MTAAPSPPVSRADIAAPIYYAYLKDELASRGLL
jgi:hypothetical protein